MQQRGRKGSAALAITSAVESVQRPDAPYELTDEQTTEWWAIVNNMRADWFRRENHPLLVQYCRHTVESHHLAQAIVQCIKTVPFDEERYGKLLAWQERETRAISALARGMQLTQQSTNDPKKKRGGPVQMARPWD